MIRLSCRLGRHVCSAGAESTHKQIQPRADPRFSRWGGGRGPSWWGGHRPLMQSLFGENVCENERIGSLGGEGACTGKFCM